MTVNPGTYPKLIRCGRPTTEGRTHMVAWGEMGEERHGMGHHYGETAAPCAVVPVAVTAGPRTPRPPLPFLAGAFARRRRRLSLSVTARTGGDGEIRGGRLAAPAGQPATLHADLVVAPSSATTVRTRSDCEQGKEGSPVAVGVDVLRPSTIVRPRRILSFILSWLALSLFVLVLKLLTLKPHNFKDTTEIFTLQIKQNIPFLLKRYL